MCSRSTNCFSISTRVSARRRTRFEKPSKSEKLISIHVSARKLTSCVIGYLQLGSIFQLTSPQGDERNPPVSLYLMEDHFNSRLREGTNTFFQVFFKRTFSITTHIPARRRTNTPCNFPSRLLFQLTSPRGDELILYL